MFDKIKSHLNESFDFFDEDSEEFGPITYNSDDNYMSSGIDGIINDDDDERDAQELGGPSMSDLDYDEEDNSPAEPLTDDDEEFLSSERIAEEEEEDSIAEEVIDEALDNILFKKDISEDYELNARLNKLFEECGDKESDNDESDNDESDDDESDEEDKDKDEDESDEEDKDKDEDETEESLDKSDEDLDEAFNMLECGLDEDEDLVQSTDLADKFGDEDNDDDNCDDCDDTEDSLDSFIGISDNDEEDDDDYSDDDYSDDYEEFDEDDEAVDESLEAYF